MDPALRAARVFGEHAEAYALKYADVGRYKSSLDRFLDLLPMDARVLELACGPGNVTRYLIEQRPDLRILATDLAPEIVEVARAACRMWSTSSWTCARSGEWGRSFTVSSVRSAYPTWANKPLPGSSVTQPRSCCPAGSCT